MVDVVIVANVSVDAVTTVNVVVAIAVDIGITVNVVVDVDSDDYIVGVVIGNARVFVTYVDTNTVNSTDASTAIL